ncbi:MAG TPA: carbohydrate ABC transporter permease [Firmicutes bacterium]|nr:carbohydrate ABC transporter permease [Bacillota bacterium]
MKQTASDKSVSIVFYGFITLFSIICLVPFILVVASSFTSEDAILRYGYNMWPREFSLEAYKLMFSTPKMLYAYGVTIFVTVVGTALSMLVSSACAYSLSVKSFYYRNIITFFIYFTMLFSGGLVPTYLWIVKYLKLTDSLWVLILPSLVNPWNVLLLRNFFAGIPESLAESAKIDGANDLVILFKIILPISLPGLATVGLFYALAYWNEWYKAMLYLRTEWKYPLQYIIMQITRNIRFAEELASMGGTVTENPPAYSSQMATAVITIGPIIFLYPFLQKYFVTGLTVGSVKG